MGWPFKTNYKQDDPVASVPHDFYNTVGNVLNEITGVGCIVEKTINGRGWRIVVDNSEFSSTTPRWAVSAGDSFNNVTIGEGTWYGHNGNSATSTATVIGDTVNKIIVATVDNPESPTTVTISARSDEPNPAELVYTRKIAELVHGYMDSDGQVKLSDYTQHEHSDIGQATAGQSFTSMNFQATVLDSASVRCAGGYFQIEEADTTNNYLVAGDSFAVTGTSYIIADLTDTTAPVVVLEDSAADPQTARRTVAKVTFAGGGISDLEQWHIGDIYAFDAESLDTGGNWDSVSLNTDGDSVLQLFNFATAGSSGTNDSEDLFPFKNNLGTISYISFSDLTAGIVAVDDISINFDSVGNLQLLNYGTTTGLDTTYIIDDPQLVDLVPIQDKSNANEIRYVTVADLSGLSDSDYWIKGASFDENYGTSIGNDSSTKVIGLDTYTLEQGPWTVTNTTPASSGAGAFVVDGGAYTANGIYCDKGSASFAGTFVDGNFAADMCDGTRAGKYVDASNTVEICDGTAAINVTSGEYWHGGGPGLTGTVQVTQGGVTKDLEFSGGIIIGLT